MMAPLPREQHRGRWCGCCCSVLCTRGAGHRDYASSCSLGRPMERWCMRRRRQAEAAEEGGARLRAGRHSAAPAPGGCERCGMDYHQQDDGCSSRRSNINEYSCDNNNSDGGSSRRCCPPPFSPPASLPRSRICDGDGPTEGAPGDALRRGARRPPSSPLFLAAAARGRVTVTSSSGRGGDGAAVRFSGDPGIREVSARSRRGGCSEGGGVRGWWCLSRSLLLVSLLWLSLGALLVDGASASIMGDGCDWSGSGLMAEMEVSREGGGVGVRPVYLRCSQGAVSWAYPRGALRVLLRLAGGGADEEFRGCVRLGRTWKGARLFLEGLRSLHPLFPGVEDGVGGDHSSAVAKGVTTTGVRCFQSRKGQAALYVEATPGGVSPRGRTVASFEYHLQPLPSGVKSFDPSEECRPCTMKEMTHAFCSSDLVTRGTIRSVETLDDPETSELRVRVTKLIRRTRAPPPALEGDPFDEDEDDELQEEDAGAAAAAGRRRWWGDSSSSADRGASVTLHVPTHCGARHGAGEFVFMAQRKLGQLRLKCAPRLEDWAELARKSNRLAASPCVLQA